MLEPEAPMAYIRTMREGNISFLIGTMATGNGRRLWRTRDIGADECAPARSRAFG
jgi:hypothetical protein